MALRGLLTTYPAIRDTALCLLASLPLATLAGCHHDRRVDRAGGDPRMGAITITRQACGSCHTIPGIEEADGRVGPPLAHFAGQQTIAGTLPNTPDDLARFLRSPRSVVQGGTMPDLALTDEQIRDIGAYLYTLK